LNGRGRACPRVAPRRARGGGRRDPRREVGRAAEGVRQPAGGRRADRGRADRLLAGDAARLQGAQRRRIRRAAEDLDRKDQEVRGAGAGSAGAPHSGPVAEGFGTPASWPPGQCSAFTSRLGLTIPSRPATPPAPISAAQITIARWNALTDWL